MVKTAKKLLIIIAFIIPYIIFLRTILIGNIAFWYDPARDLLLAWDNLSKLSLIGPTTGIPGVFYGPYWIWLLSIALFFSKNPRFAVFLVSTIPLAIIFPIILFRFKFLFRKHILLLVWLMFLYADGMGYATTIWNPNLSILFLLVTIYLLLTVELKDDLIIKVLKYSAAGVFSGLLINFHMSLGIGVFVGIIVFLFMELCLEVGKRPKKIPFLIQQIPNYLFFALGFGFTFLPFLAFEVRHGFNQIKTLSEAFTNYGAVVNVTGLSKTEVLKIFFGRMGFILHHNSIFVGILEAATFIYSLIFILKGKIKINSKEQKLILLLISIIFGILFIYLTARNPVWEYHFIGTEVIFLLLIALVISRFLMLRILVFLYVIYLITTISFSFIKNINISAYNSSSLVTKEHIVDIIGKDSKGQNYSIYPYSSAIYVYEYSYLFRWRQNKELSFDPNQEQTAKKFSLSDCPKY